MYSRGHRKSPAVPATTQVLVESRPTGNSVPAALSTSVRPTFYSSDPPCGLASCLWQGVLFIDGKATGRLVAPSVDWVPGKVQEQAEAAQAEAVGQVSLHFSRIVPAGAAAAAAAPPTSSSSRASSGLQQQQQTPAQPLQGQPLRLPVDECFAQRSYRVQVIGRQPDGGANFAAPHAFHADGRELTAALSVQRQWQEYQQRHQAARASAGQPVSAANFAHSSTLTVQSGDGLERLQAIFDVATRPAWLKGIVCRFLAAEASQQQPGKTGPVDGSGGSIANATEQGGAAAAGAAEIGAGSMAATVAAGCSEADQGSCVAAANQRRPQVEQQPAANALQPAGVQKVAGADAHMVQADAVVQHPTPGASEGKSTRGSRSSARKHRDDHAPAAVGSSSNAAAAAAAPLPRPASRASSAGSSSGSASAGAVQPAAGRRSKAGAGNKLAQQPAAQQPTSEDATSAAGGTPGAEGSGAASKSSGRRSRSNSRTRGSGQDAAAARRMPKHLAATAEQQPQVAGGSSLPAVPERSEAPNSSPSPAPQSRRGSRAAEQRACSSAPGESPRSPPAAGGAGRGRRGGTMAGAAATEGAPGARPAQAATSAAAAVPGPAPAAASAAPAAPCGVLGCPPQFTEAELLAADLLDLPPSAIGMCDCGCSCSQQPAAPPGPQFVASTSCRGSTWPCTQSSLSVAAPVWRGAADSSDLAAMAAGMAEPLAAPPMPPLPQQLSQGLENSSSISRPATPAEAAEWDGSVCSDGSRGSHSSWHSDHSYGMPSRPSDWGLSYNFGHPSPLSFNLPLEHEQTIIAAGQMQQRSLGSSPPLAEAALRPSYRRSTGSFARSMVPVMGNGSGFYPVSAPLHPSAASMPVLQMPAYHRRSASSSSNSSQSGGEGPPPVPVPLPAAYQAGQRWPNATRTGWADPYALPSQQHYMQVHSQLSVQPPPFAPRPHASFSRQQWPQRHYGAEAGNADAYWQAQRRMGSSSSSWQQPSQHHDAGLAAHKAPPQPAAPVPHCTPVSNRLSSPLPASSSHMPRSAPASTASSPLLDHGRQVPPPPSSTPPPLPLPTVPALDLQVPESTEDSPDLERFLQAATPQVFPPPTGAQDLTLADLWRWYEGPSTVGCEVSTIGGPRGPATAYYLPYLSAVQLLVPASAADEAAVVAAASGQPGCPAGQSQSQLLSYPNGLESWPERMRPVVQWGEAANMRDRVPLHSRLLDLCSDAGDSHPLMATHIADLHPLTWFAVAWYPLYCVPEAPLTARFLTFHTLASLWETASEAAAKHRQQHEEALAAAAAEAQRQWLQAAAEEARVAAAAAAAGSTPRQGSLAGAEGQASPPGAAAASTPRSPGPPTSSGAAVEGLLRSRPSYKSMLATGLPPPDMQQLLPVTVTYTATPTAVCSFPGSPTCSDAGTRTTLDLDSSSRPHSVDGAAASGSGSATAVRSRLALSSGTDSLAVASSYGGGSSLREHGSATASAATSASAVTTPASPPASEVGDAAEPLPVPVAGLAWYATGRDENWTETLVAAQLPPGTAPSPGMVLAGGARLLGSWRGVAVVARPYPVAKGGPLGWEIQQEEMAQCAERLAAGMGLVALRPRVGSGGAAGGSQVSWDRVGRLPPAALGVSCPDYEFFAARSARYC